MVFTDPFAVKRSDSTTFAGSVGVTMDPSVSKRYTSPFPPLQLSATTTMELEGLAQRLVTRNIGAYESFLIDNHGKVDEDKWKFVSSKDDLKAYAEQPRVVESPHPYQQETPVADLPVVMITGTVVGDLDDVMRQHQLTFLLPDLRLKQRLVTVCRSCEIEAISESAMGIARDELLQGNQMQRWDSGDVFNTTMSSQSLQSE
ncbi:hypothetical protein PC119_g20911 [Phytophthora cactorum]|uniref:Uncharacterized protein n=1 Tax=Phytophthora cactorum TaxID=29920 RepID=A0A8T1BET2_9STRA|nr:hypothetical protein PC115_g16787 [Phytophthora cactorum]KAG2982002.1 hypothetical protein PC119_g20911 [Phytophthora cactorum]